MTLRAVPLDDEQYFFIEDLGKKFLRVGDQDVATKLLAIALAWKVAPVLRFVCDVDESAGMAEGRLIELQSYSRKVSNE